MRSPSSVFSIGWVFWATSAAFCLAHQPHQSFEHILANAPKVELHNHLDGSMSPETVWRIGQAVGFVFPKDVHGPADLARYVMAQHAASLSDFLKTFNFFYPVISGGTAPLAVEMMAEAFVAQQAASNVIYSEVRFAPQLFTSINVSTKDIVEASLRGIRKGIVKAQANGQTIDAQLIVCCMRGNLPPKSCGEIVKLANEMKGIGQIVGVDLAGDEQHFSNDLWVPFYEEMHRLGIHRTVHSGEEGPNATHDCEMALTQMYAERIGHGYHCLGSKMAVAKLQQRKVHVEACPSSSEGTHATAPLGPNHPIAKFAKLGFDFGLNTDDGGVLGTNMTHEFQVAQKSLGFSLQQLKRSTEAAAAHIFADKETSLRLIEDIQRYWHSVPGVMTVIV